MTDKKTIKILLVEDDPFLLNMYVTGLELDNFRVLVAEDGERGLELARTEQPDVVLLDILLPGMNGFEVLKAIRSSPKISSTPVILLTNLSQKGEVEKGLALGASEYIIKAHFTPAEVVDKIKEMIKKGE